jgi:hypothetical protein
MNDEELYEFAVLNDWGEGEIVECSTSYDIEYLARQRGDRRLREFYAYCEQAGREQADGEYFDCRLDRAAGERWLAAERPEVARRRQAAPLVGRRGH